MSADIDCSSKLQWQNCGSIISEVPNDISPVCRQERPLWRIRERRGAEVVHLLKKDDADPDYVSQRKAFEMFGRRNVERWRRQGKVSPYKRPGKLEYRTADLRLLQRSQQDYLDPNV